MCDNVNSPVSPFFSVYNMNMNMNVIVSVCGPVSDKANDLISQNINKNTKYPYVPIH